jgi:L-ribulose-5-phosphate 3-epimerase
MKLGVSLEAFRVPFRTALARASKLGVSGVQCDAVGDLAPQRLTATGRREITHLVRSHNLAFTALVCPLRRGLDEPLDLEPRLARIREVMSLSFELDARIVIVEAGRIPEDRLDPRKETMTESLQNLGSHGDRTGTILALQAGLDSGAVLANFLSQLDTGGLGVNFDPGNLLLNGYDPVAELSALRGRIVHVHATDARRGGASRSIGAVLLGRGDLDWLQLAGNLAAQDYRGWVVVERAGNPTETDMATSVALLRRLI